MRSACGIRYGSGALALAVSLLVAACATSRGREIRSDVVERLKAGEMAEQEVRAWLGAPQEARREGDTTVLRYRYDGNRTALRDRRGWNHLFPFRPAVNKHRQRLEVVIGEQSRVLRYTYREEFDMGF
ncbi:MAG: hypothetical protein HYY85_16890 [Deltaproteobacteria bacterium]|nr:hypothetical protein [Deltaproteobacteria bacterium]